MTSAVALEWVPINRYCEMTGESSDAVDKRVRSGHWLRDVHVRVPTGSSRMWINLEAVNEWAAGNPTPLPRVARRKTS